MIEVWLREGGQWRNLFTGATVPAEELPGGGLGNGALGIMTLGS